MTPDQVIDEIKRSNLRERGGGGFQTGIKLETTRSILGSGSGFSFHVKIHQGTDAFVSGESSALLSAIEGKGGVVIKHK